MPLPAHASATFRHHRGTTDYLVFQSTGASRLYLRWVVWPGIFEDFPASACGLLGEALWP